MRWLSLTTMVAMCLTSGFAKAEEPIQLRRLVTMQSPKNNERGAIVYLHGTRRPGVFIDSLPVGYAAFARSMKLDQLAVVRAQEYNTPQADGLVIDFTVKQLRNLVAEEGYRKIYLAGQSWGAWLAAFAASISTDVDGLLISAPGNTTLAEDELIKHRDRLASLLEATKARRVFVVFFAGDPREAIPGGRGEVTTNALARAKIPFWVLDQPHDLVGHGAIAEGRFARRYTECLQEFFGKPQLVAGPFECKFEGRYAAGGDINYPDIRPIKLNAATFVPDTLTPFLGQWRGDSEEGAYMILTPAHVKGDEITFVLGYSPAPFGRGSPWIRELAFKLAADGKTLTYTYPTGRTLKMRVVEKDQAVLDAEPDGARYPTRFMLRRQPDTE